MIRNNIFIVCILLFTLIGCSGIGISPINNTNFYSAEFLRAHDSIALIYKDGDKLLALQKLQQIKDETITTAEMAKKYNFIGVIYFSRNNSEKAVENFQLAKQYVSKDYQLASQINLNLASSYFKMNKFDLCKTVLRSVNTDYFTDKEKLKFHRLNLSVSNQLGDSSETVNSLIYLLMDAKRFRDIDDYKYKEMLIDNYKKLSESERVFLLNKYQESRPTVSAYLAKQEVMFRFYEGDRAGANDVVAWLDNNFGKIEEVKNFITDFKFRVENFSKINPNAIGVVIPLSHSKSAHYGKSVLAGINTAIEKGPNSRKDLKLYIKDNQNNKFLAKKMIHELVMKHHVSIIIGGLFPKLAYEEYLEAKKYGVMYISLSQVYLPREQKTNLLIELQGSVESQINTMLQPEALDYFGKRMAVFYPWSEKGKSYVNEFWGYHNSGKIELANLGSFKEGVHQFTNPVQKLLWLKYPRERKEELLIWKDIRSAASNNVRIINEMPPIVDFDWVFIPSLPSEALQIIPTFSYFDAKRLKFIGGPSWRSRNLKKEQGHNGNSYLIGNDISDIDESFQVTYKNHNGTSPKLVDTLSYEGMLLVKSILGDKNFSKRNELESRLRKLSELKGIISKWNLTNGLWLKEMDIVKISSKGFTKVELKQ